MKLSAEPKAAEVANVEVGVGHRLKVLRTSLGFTLKELALRAACSESLLSKIENGRASPSIAMLHRIAVALRTTVSDLFGNAGGKRSASVVLPAGSRPLVRMGDDLNPLDGVLVERLTPPDAGAMLQADVYVIPPGCGSGGVLQHEGEEMGLVLEGSIELVVAGEVCLVKAGDSFVFKSTLPHSFINRGVKAARVVWVNTPPSF